MACAALAASLATSGARAQTVCHRGRAAPRAAIAVALDQGDLAADPVACAVTSASLDARATALIDTPDFYGRLQGELVVSGSVALTPRVWLSGAVTPLRLRFAQNASLVATDLGTGLGSLGVHGALVAARDVSWSLWGRALLPLETGSHWATTVGGEVGTTLLWAPSRPLTVTATLSVPVTATVLGARARWSSAGRLSFSVGYLATSWLEPMAGVELRVGDRADGAGEYVAPKLGVRLHPGRGFGVHLDAMLPLGGSERADVRAALGVSHAW